MAVFQIMNNDVVLIGSPGNEDFVDSIVVALFIDIFVDFDKYRI